MEQTHSHVCNNSEDEHKLELIDGKANICDQGIKIIINKIFTRFSFESSRNIRNALRAATYRPNAIIVKLWKNLPEINYEEQMQISQ